MFFVLYLLVLLSPFDKVILLDVLIYSIAFYAVLAALDLFSVLVVLTVIAVVLVLSSCGALTVIDHIVVFLSFLYFQKYYYFF